MPAPRVVYLVINGIRTEAGNLNGWVDRAVTRLLLQGLAAQGNEYEAHALTRRFGHEERVRIIAKRIGYFQRAGFLVRLIVHSNGAFIAGDVFVARGQADPGEGYTEPVDSAHLIGPACDAEDIARALREADVRRVFVYGSKNDRALKAGRLSRRLLGWISVGGHPLGYGSLGLDCSALVREFPDHAFDCGCDEFDHSTWLEEGQLDVTLDQVVRNDRLTAG